MKKKRRASSSFFLWIIFLLAAFIFLGMLVFSGYRALWVPPSSFPTAHPLRVEKGDTLHQIAVKLEKKGYVHNADIFQWTMMSLESEKSVDAGNYYFDKKLGTLALARHLARGVFGIGTLEVTYPEGFTVGQIAKRSAKKFPLVSVGQFIQMAKPKEGFLFPDTYEFFTDVRAKKIIDTMEKNFDLKTKKLQQVIQERGKHTVRQIIIMASLLEEEASTTKDRRIISGILWSRIKIGMPLQVDATFAYFLGKNTYELTYKDLKRESPYNTYTNLGLPVGPISNPGLDAIKAAMNPIPTDYIYYLSDRSGNVYYSQTLDEHRRYKEKYVN